MMDASLMGWGRTLVSLSMHGLLYTDQRFRATGNLTIQIFITLLEGHLI